MDEHLSLKWNNHKSRFLHILTILRDKKMYSDATLACKGKFYSVHRLVLSTCSDYFSAMFDQIECKNPIIVLKDIKCEDLEALLDYMYLGEVNVKQSELSSLITAAECLELKGLAIPDDDLLKKGSSIKESSDFHFPSAKRKRKEDDNFSSNVKLNHRQSLLNLPPNNIISDNESQPSTSEINEELHTSNIAFVKVEKDEIPEDSFDINHDIYKVDNNDVNVTGGDMRNEMDEFLRTDNPLFDETYGESSFHSEDNHHTVTGSNVVKQQDYRTSVGSENTLDNLLNDAQSYPENTYCVGQELRCRLCDKQFHYSSSLKQKVQRHMMTHTGEKPFQCPNCNYKCSRKDVLKNHVTNMHCTMKLN